MPTCRFLLAATSLVAAACAGNHPPPTAPAGHGEHAAGHGAHHGPHGAEHGHAAGHGEHGEHGGHGGHDQAAHPGHGGGREHAGRDVAAHDADRMADHGAHGGGGMHHRFEDAERWARVFDDPARDAWQRPDEVVALCELRPGMVVADVGAGTGYFVGRLSAAVGARGQVIATDLEADMVRYLGERGQREGWRNVRAVQVAAGETGLRAASVDRVLIVDVWHHLGDRVAYARQLAAALRPQGAVIVVDFTLDATRGPPPAHRLAPEVIVGELAAAGLDARVVKESLPDQYVIVARRR